jgi:hypothetical protein
VQKFSPLQKPWLLSDKNMVTSKTNSAPPQATASTRSPSRKPAISRATNRLTDSEIESLQKDDRGRAGEDQGNAGPGSLEDGPLFSRSRLADIKDSALTQLDSILSHPGKVSMWDKTVGTMRHLAERNPFFKPVYESAQQNIDDVSMLANDAADRRRASCLESTAWATSWARTASARICCRQQGRGPPSV